MRSKKRIRKGRMKNRSRMSRSSKRKKRKGGVNEEDISMRRF